MKWFIYDGDFPPAGELDPANKLCEVEAETAEAALRDYWEAFLADPGITCSWVWDVIAHNRLQYQCIPLVDTCPPGVIVAVPAAPVVQPAGDRMNEYRDGYAAGVKLGRNLPDETRRIVLETERNSETGKLIDRSVLIHLQIPGEAIYNGGALDGFWVGVDPEKYESTHSGLMEQILRAVDSL